MEPKESLLQNYSDEEKGAYLGAIASIGTADSIATGEEIEFLRTLAEGANLSKKQEEAVIRAASEMSDNELIRCLNILKNSDLRFSLLTDIMSFANADGKYSEEEKADVEKIASHLQVNREQFSLLDQFVKKSENITDPETATRPNFLESLGLNDKFQKAGIDPGRISKGLLSVIGPLLLGGMLSRSMRRGQGFSNSGRFGMNPGMSGGIGSLISLLSGSRGYRGMRNMTPKLFGR